jgi:hypothetical protein
MAKKGFLVVILAVLAAGAASAQVTISGGFALSYLNANISGDGGSYKAKGDVGVGGNIYLDYLLPIGIPMSLGIEAGVDSSSFTDTGYTDTVLAIPLLVRAAYHFDLHPKFDLYLVGKIGFVLGIWSGDQRDMVDQAGATVNPDSPMGMGFGFDIGAAYYFTPLFGLFAEGGFDGYMLKSKIDFPGGGGGGGSLDLDVPFYRFFTLGFSTKF